MNIAATGFTTTGFTAACFATAGATATRVGSAAVDRVEIGCILNGFGSVAHVVGYFTMDNNLVAHLDLVVAVNPLLVAEVESAVHVELTGC